jgi:hypothetical protein
MAFRLSTGTHICLELLVVHRMAVMTSADLIVALHIPRHQARPAVLQHRAAHASIKQRNHQKENSHGLC